MAQIDPAHPTKSNHATRTNVALVGDVSRKLDAGVVLEKLNVGFKRGDKKGSVRKSQTPPTIANFDPQPTVPSSTPPETATINAMPTKQTNNQPDNDNNNTHRSNDNFAHVVKVEVADARKSEHKRAHRVAREVGGDPSAKIVHAQRCQRGPKRVAGHPHRISVVPATGVGGCEVDR